MARSEVRRKYHKLTGYALEASKLSSSTLLGVLESKGWYVPRNATNVELAVAFGRAASGLLDLRQCITKELQTFCKRRGLSITGTHTIALATPAKLIDRLEEADDKRTFYGLMRLPAELREYIFELYTLFLIGPAPFKGERFQSPLTQVSRLVRQESLPLFYKFQLFTLDSMNTSQPESVDGLGSKRCLDDKAVEWLHITPDHCLNRVRRLRVRRWESNKDHWDPRFTSCYETWCIRFDASPGNRAVEVHGPGFGGMSALRRKRITVDLSEAVDALVSSSIDRDGIRKLVEIVED